MIYKHIETTLVNDEYVWCSEANAKDFRIVFLINFAMFVNVSFIEMNQAEFLGIHFIYHHTNYTCLNWWLYHFSINEALTIWK
jgi:hypothetical protein